MHERFCKPLHFTIDTVTLTYVLRLIWRLDAAYMMPE